MKPADVFLAVLVAVIWGLAFVASRIALDEFSPELMTALRFVILGTFLGLGCLCPAVQALADDDPLPNFNAPVDNSPLNVEKAL